MVARTLVFRKLVSKKIQIAFVMLQGLKKISIEAYFHMLELLIV